MNRNPAHLPLVPSVSRGLARSDNPDSVYSDKEFMSVRPSVLEEAEHRCAFCAFQSLKFTEVHHLDGDHRNNSRSNLVPACRLCHLTQHLGFVGVHGGAHLILSDEPQDAINHIVRSLWVAKYGSDTALKQQATAMLETLPGFSEQVETRYGYSSPLQLANELAGQTDKKYNDRAKYLSGIRIIFSEKLFHDQIRYWVSETYKPFSTKDWGRIYEQYIG